MIKMTSANKTCYCRKLCLTKQTRAIKLKAHIQSAAVTVLALELMVVKNSHQPRSKQEIFTSKKHSTLSKHVALIIIKRSRISLLSNLEVLRGEKFLLKQCKLLVINNNKVKLTLRVNS